MYTQIHFGYICITTYVTYTTGRFSKWDNSVHTTTLGVHSVHYKIICTNRVVIFFLQNVQNLEKQTKRNKNGIQIRKYIITNDLILMTIYSHFFQRKLN